MIYNWWFMGFFLIPFWTITGSIILFMMADMICRFKLSEGLIKWRTSVKKKKRLKSLQSQSPLKSRRLPLQLQSLNLRKNQSQSSMVASNPSRCYVCQVVMHLKATATVYGQDICHSCQLMPPDKLIEWAGKKMAKGYSTLCPYCGGKPNVHSPTCTYSVTTTSTTNPLARCSMCGTTGTPGMSLTMGICSACMSVMYSPYGMNVPQYTTGPYACSCGASSQAAIYHSIHCNIHNAQPTPPPEKEELPLNQQYVGGLRLIRGFVVNVLSSNKGAELRALATQFTWTGDVMKAHKTPALKETGAGFFGFYRWDWSQTELAGVGLWGTYIGWGRTVRGSMGMRTEYAKLEALCLNPEIDKCSDFERQKTVKYAEMIANNLGVPFKHHSELRNLKTGIIPLDQKRIDSWLEASK